MLKHSLRYSEAVSIKSYLTDSSIELYRALLYSQQAGWLKSDDNLAQDCHKQSLAKNALCSS